MSNTGSADWATNFLMGGVAASISKTVAAPIVRLALTHTYNLTLSRKESSSWFRSDQQNIEGSLVLLVSHPDA